MTTDVFKHISTSKKLTLICRAMQHVYIQFKSFHHNVHIPSNTSTKLRELVCTRRIWVLTYTTLVHTFISSF
jgi:hypothetical protein